MCWFFAMLPIHAAFWRSRMQGRLLLARLLSHAGQIFCAFIVWRIYGCACEVCARERNNARRGEACERERRESKKESAESEREKREGAESEKEREPEIDRQRERVCERERARERASERERERERERARNELEQDAKSLRSRVKL